MAAQDITFCAAIFFAPRPATHELNLMPLAVVLFLARIMDQGACFLIMANCAERPQNSQQLEFLLASYR